MFKKLCYTCTILFLLSCTGNDYEETEHACGIGLRISTSITSSRAVSKSAFTENDAIGIYLVSYVEGLPGILGDIRNPQNREYIFKGTEWIADSGDELFLNETWSDLYAYYPYDPELGYETDKMNVGSYPFSIPSDQSILINGIDFLWGKVEGLSLTNNRANILFHHVLTRIVINLYYNDGNTQGISDVQIHNLVTTCLIDLRTGTITPTGTATTIKPYQLEIPETGYDFSYEAIVVPGAVADGAPVVSLVHNGERLLFAISGDQELLPGTTYTFNLSIGSATPELLSTDEQNHFLKQIPHEYK